jgi:hypothetical protein
LKIRETRATSTQGVGMTLLRETMKFEALNGSVDYVKRLGTRRRRRRE